MLDRANETIKTSREFEQSICDELAVTAAQTALRNDGKKFSISLSAQVS